MEPPTLYAHLHCGYFGKLLLVNVHANHSVRARDGDVAGGGGDDGGFARLAGANLLAEIDRDGEDVAFDCYGYVLPDFLLVRCFPDC